MAKEMSDRLKEARIDAGYASAAKAAEAMGVRPSTYQAHENGSRGFKRESVIRYARFFKVSLPWLEHNQGPKEARGKKSAEHPEIGRVSVQGEVRAGAWLEIDEVRDEKSTKYLNVVLDPRYEEIPQFALKVVGESMNRTVRDGEYVICASWPETGQSLRDGLLVIVQRQRGSTVEVTVKRVRGHQSHWELWPESDDPRYQTPYVYAEDTEDEVKVIALVLAIHRPVI